jgi:heme oxygenase
MVKDSLEYHTYNKSVKDYVSYIRKLEDPKRILAHLYTWHMGDMFGGQMIKTMIPAPHTHLTFDNAKELMTTLRTMITDDLADEANTAFDWAIKILSEYDV